MPWNSIEDLDLSNLDPARNPFERRREWGHSWLSSNDTHGSLYYKKLDAIFTRYMNQSPVRNEASAHCTLCYNFETIAFWPLSSRLFLPKIIVNFRMPPFLPIFSAIHLFCRLFLACPIFVDIIPINILPVHLIAGLFFPVNLAFIKVYLRKIFSVHIIVRGVSLD